MRHAGVAADHNVTTSPVVRDNYCIGCGVCAGVCVGAALSMELCGDEYRPVQTGRCIASCSQCLHVCPFGELGADETAIAAGLFADAPQSDPLLGRFISTSAGFVSDGESRRQAASGGATSLMLCELLDRGLVDAVVTAAPVADGFPWWDYRVVTTAAEVAGSRGSIYHPLQLGGVLRRILAEPDRRHAVVALPCYAKALRLASRRLPALARRLRFVLSLTCGGSSGFAYPLSTAMLAGVSRPRGIRYHVKSSANFGRLFGFAARDGAGVEHTIGESGGIATFLRASRAYRKGCFFCDDVFGECADATFMDAWLPQFEADRGGTSLAILRHRELANLWDDVQRSGVWRGEPIEPGQVIASQGKLCRNKRAGLRVRLEAASTAGRWAPPKRVALLGTGAEPGAKSAMQQGRRAAACDALGELFARWFAEERDRDRSPRGARLEAWRLCRRVAGVLRGLGIRPASSRGQLFWRGMMNLLCK